MVIFLISLFVTLCLVLAVKMTVAQHVEVYNTLFTVAVVTMVAVVAIYVGVCAVRCYDICVDLLSTGVVGAAVPARLRKAISECSYGLSETSHGHGPKARRVYKARASKVQRQIDAIEIAEGLEDVLPVEPVCEWTQFDEDYAISLCTREDEINEMWDEWTTERDSFCGLPVAFLRRLEDYTRQKRLSAMFALNKQIECDAMWHNHEMGGE